MILKGTVYITDKEEIVYSIPLNSNTKIINLDEDGVLIENEAIVGGTCLLPPIEAKIAEADGNEQLYDMIYTEHLLAPYQQSFIAALVSYLYKGGNLLIFLPDIGNYTRDKFVYFIYKLFGIHCGIINDPNPAIANFYYDNDCIPIWANLIYSANVISAYEYLYIYPADAMINNQAIINQLIDEINPYCETINDNINYILKLHQLIHKNPNIRPAIGFNSRRDL